MKTENAITWWERAHRENADHVGEMYPPCIGLVNDVVAIADADDNGSNLTMYTAENFVKWVKAAIKFKMTVNDGHNYSDYDALMETETTDDYHETH